MNGPQNSSSLRVLIAGGGTGGHLFPGIALAEAFVETGAAVHFAGSARGIEVQAVPRAGYPLHLIPVRGLKGGGFWGRLRGLALLPLAFFASWRLLRRIRPHLVVGVGGYASGPVVFTAALLGLPTAVMEQNTIPGITNRKLARRARRVYVSFPESARYFPPEKVREFGNPVREFIVKNLSDAAAEKTGTSEGAMRILVFGGSQGAHAINELFAAAAPELARRGVIVRHQTGTADKSRVEEAYRTAGVNAQVDEFIHDMAQAYAQADAVVCRAGATTCAELAIAGKPAVFIPFPYAADNHQEHNARSLVERGAALLLREADATPEKLVEILQALTPEKLAGMREAMRQAARPESARLIRDDLLSLLK